MLNSSLSNTVFIGISVDAVDDNILGPALPPDVKVNAVIKQRFPVENRADSALPSGLEIVSLHRIARIQGELTTWLSIVSYL